MACGAAGGIAATFNAPLTGLFFGFEIILREFSLDALFATILSAVTADLVSRAFFGSAPFFAQIPHDLSSPTTTATYSSPCSGPGRPRRFRVLRRSFTGSRTWPTGSGRDDRSGPSPAVGGLALGVLLLALPEMYGVGYPVMDQIIAGHDVLWFIVILMVGKIVASSLTLSIGGSGGVFAPSLFTGAAGGMAFGVIGSPPVRPAVVGPPAIYAVVAMGGVFAAAAQAPLTAIASVVEMTGNFTLMLPVMLAAGIAAAVSKKLSYGSIYTTKLLRRGIDIERPKATGVLQMLTVADVMQPVPARRPESRVNLPTSPANLESLARIGSITSEGPAQVLFEDETLDQALRQLTDHGRAGLPVISRDAEHLRGWVTRHNVLSEIAGRLGLSEHEAEADRPPVDPAQRYAESAPHVARSALENYEIVEVTIDPRSPLAGRRLADVDWPPGSYVVAVTEKREIVQAKDDTELQSGERVILLAPAASGRSRTPTPPPPGPKTASTPA